MSKIPFEAFAYYAQVRSYEQVAAKFGVTKRAVVKCAKRERWQERLSEVERQAKERVEKKLAETLEAMTERHLRSLRVIQGKALEALRTMTLGTAMDAVRALDLAIRQERVIRGEPGERSEIQTGVLVAPAGVTPEDWIAEATARNEKKRSPLEDLEGRQ